MKILIFIPCFTNGGAEKQAYILAKYLNRNHDITIWGFPSEHTKSYTDKLKKNGIKYSELKRWPKINWNKPNNLHQNIKHLRDLYLLEKDIIKILPNETFDIIIPFTFWPSLSAVFMKNKHMAKYTIWGHRGGNDNAGIPYTKSLIKKIIKSHPIFVSNSNPGAVFIKDTFSQKQKDIHIINNAYQIDPKIQKNIINQNHKATTINLIHVANFYPEKDYTTILKAISLLKHYNVKLHIAGYFITKQEELSHLKLVDDLGVSDAVIFHGSLSNNQLKELLSLADIGLLSSKSEGTPNCIMEYMSFSLPVVATNIKGISDLIPSDNHQFLFNPGDQHEAASKIRKLILDKGLSDKSGQKNKAYLRANYNINLITSEWDNLLSSCVK